MASCQNTSKAPAIDMANFDLSVAPDADFYQYATGGWQKNNPLKPEYSRYGSFDVLRDNNEKRINELFSEMTKISAAPGSVEQKISDLYKMGLDSTRLNAEGAAPLKSAVEEILSVEDRGQLTGIVAKLHTTVANPFFGVGVQADLMNSDINALYISQSGLTMGNRDYYLDPENEHIRRGYKEYLGRIFRFAGIPEADVEKAVAGVMNVETKLAEKSWSNVELRNIPAQYNPTAKADFEKTYDAVDWEAYYKAMGIGDFETIIVSTPSAVANANDLLKNAPLEDIRYYLAAQYIDAAAPYLSDDFQQASFDFYGKVMSGQQEMKPRWKRAMSVPNGTLSEAVGEMYVAKYFPAKDKERMLTLVKNLQTALGQHIAALDWMSDATKAKAQEKLAAFTVKIGYPDKWKDYSTLEIDPSKSYWENIVNANRWYTADNISELGKPVDKEKWHMSPQTVNAYYNPTTNEILLPGRHSPAAVLQPRRRRRGELRCHRRGDRPRDDPRIRRSGPQLRQGRQHEQLVDRGGCRGVQGQDRYSRETVRCDRGAARQGGPACRHGQRFAQSGREHRRSGRPARGVHGVPQLAERRGACADRQLHGRPAFLSGLCGLVGTEHPRRGDRPSHQDRRALAGQVARERHAAQPADVLRCVRHYRRGHVHARTGACDRLVGYRPAG